MPLAIKSVSQPVAPTPCIIDLMECFRRMVNECLKIGLLHDVSSMKALCSVTYKSLAKYDVIAYYRLCAISHAAGILTDRKKSIKRGITPRDPYARRPLLISCYGFKIIDGTLKVPLGHGKYQDIQLNAYVNSKLSDCNLRVRSFVFTADNTVSLCYSKEVSDIECKAIAGIDMNLRNVTIADKEVIHYDLSKTIDIAETTRSIIKSFKRNDVRIRRKLYQKYGRRRKQRVDQLLHRLTKEIVCRAKLNTTAIALEDISYIRRLYKKGNYQGRTFRAKMNSWSFGEVKRQIEYKAAWEAIPVIQLTKSETMGTSQLCPQCGKKITQVDRKTRQLWCAECKKWMDRDVVAAMNISIKGLARFASSKGLASEAMKGNPTTTVILRVDASKLASRRHQPNKPIEPGNGLTF
jgi:putative transposase